MLRDTRAIYYLKATRIYLQLQESVAVRKGRRKKLTASSTVFVVNTLVISICSLLKSRADFKMFTALAGISKSKLRHPCYIKTVATISVLWNLTIHRPQNLHFFFAKCEKKCMLR